MINTIKSAVVGVSLIVGGWLGIYQAPQPEIKTVPQTQEKKVGAFSDPYLSIQVGTSPQNGYYLQTDGTNSSWQPVIGGGGSGGGTFSTTTCGSVFCNFPNNVTDVVVIGSTATTSAEFYYDPNAFHFFVKSASSTIAGPLDVIGNFRLPLLSQGFAYIGSGGKLNSLASSSILLQDLGGAVTDAQVPNTITVDLAGTATALAANGTNASAGNAILGVDASGNAEGAFDVWTEAENTAAAYTPQARTLTVAGTANQITSSAGAQDLSANRTWTLSFPNQTIFPQYASSTLGFSTPYASSTVWRGGGLTTDCDTAATSKLLWDTTTGQFSCGTDQTGGGGSGNVATSSTETSGYVPFWTSTGATPATLSGGVSSFTFNNATPQLALTKGDTGLTPVLSISNSSTGDASVYFSVFSGADWAMGIDNSDSDAFKIQPSTSLSTGEPFKIDTTGRVTFTHASSTYSSFLHASTTNFTFGGVTGNKWTDFCTSITGSADLCDGSDASGAGGSSAYEIATTSDIALSQVAYISKVSGRTTLASVATTTPTIGSSLSYTGTMGNVLGGSSGTLSLNLANANTWTAKQDFFGAASSTLLSANWLKVGATASTTIDTAGNVSLPAAGTLTVPALTSALLQTDANGLFAEYAGTSCTNQFVRSLSALGVATCATVGASDVSLANLTATDSTLTFSGTYNGSTARTIGLNLGNANTWTVNQTFNYSSSTVYSSFVNASTTNLFLGTGQGALYTGSGQKVNVVATSTPTVTAPITYSGTLGQFLGGSSGTFDCTSANGSTKGCITSTDWTTFNGKLSSYDAWTHTLFGGQAGGNFFSATTSMMAIGTSTAPNNLSALTVSSSTASQLALSAGAGIAQWTMRNAGGNLYFSTTTVAGTATTSTAALSLFGSGVPSLIIGTSTPSSVSNGMVVLGTGSANASTTIQMGKIQFDGYSSSGTRQCVFWTGSAWGSVNGACTQ